MKRHRSYGLIIHIKGRILRNKKTFIVYSVLRALVIFAGIRSAWKGEYESLAICVLSLILFLLPEFFAEQFKVEIPPIFESIIYLFIFAAEILGEVNRYYTEIPGWDTMLHTINGIICAAIGFSLMDILNRKNTGSYLSPLSLAFVAFCFSMTVGVVWEFIEFGADHIFWMDMQKDRIIGSFSSVALDPAQTQKIVRVSNITRTVIETADGSRYTIENGYLDIGIIDTMKDLLVNCAGAVICSVIGYFSAKNRETRSGRFAEKLMFQTLSDEELVEQQRMIDQQAQAIRDEITTRIQQVTKH